jgi:hypothetical protein
MHVPKKYFHDRLVLLLITSLVFFSLLTAIFVIFNISGERNEGFIVQYRPTLGLSAFQKGGSLGIFSFVLFAAVVCVFHIFLSMKVYPLKKSLALTILAMGVLLVVLALIISNSLLLLR